MLHAIKVYLVGGAVRDTLLRREVTEHDYVVVGATPQQMLDFGFSQVGADFPVFLHPHSHDEYALARTERKSGSGYLGFSVQASPDVTLEDDLIRRDLTINAMAIEVNSLFDNTFKQGEFNKSHVIDPYGGIDDLEKRQLRHVSQAFSEDPVRVLRLARFASRYAPLGFTIAEETIALVRQMRDEGELNHLVAERIWAETYKALGQDWGDVYFDTLNMLGVLGVIFPEFAIMREKAAYSHEWEYIKHALRQCASQNTDIIIKFALLALVFMRFDSQQPDMTWFHDFCQRLKVPKNYQQFGEFILLNFQQLMNFDTLIADEYLAMFKASSALQDSHKLHQALQVAHVYRLAKNQVKLATYIDTIKPISAKDVEPTLTGKAIGEAIEKLRQEKLAKIL